MAIIDSTYLYQDSIDAVISGQAVPAARVTLADLSRHPRMPAATRFTFTAVQHPAPTFSFGASQGAAPRQPQLLPAQQGPLWMTAEEQREADEWLRRPLRPHRTPKPRDFLGQMVSH
jgi:hypothetical protein